MAHSASQQQHRHRHREHTHIPDLTFPMNSFHICEPEMPLIPLHWHEHLEWMVILKGSFRVQVGSASRTLHAGEAAFVNVRQIHAAFPEEEGSELYAVVFNEALLRNSSMDSTEARYIAPLLSGSRSLPEFYTLEMAATGEVRACIVGIVSSFRLKQQGYELLVKAGLLGVLGHAFQLADDSEARGRSSRPEGVIHPLLVHLSSRFTEALTVGEAAQICCISPNYLCYIFKKATGKTLVEYINMLRIHEAVTLLRSGEGYSVEQVGHRVGFSNSTYFGRVFRKFKGITPGEYARRMELAAKTNAAPAESPS
ncbi:helix-turn-helix domain-containing protein [Paenibacillus sp. HW567]|uniref:helix-turn-helix domain-containing protein n=1 Tax=Paenibacillus sp. HW567 TaxID=1034769 RepID=UPI00037BD5CD|nr:AraC family transcriptional regulator [Paenibacillus sp. HW567]